VPAAAAIGGLLWLLREVTGIALVPLGALLYAALMWAISPGAREALAGMRR
jgi:succinate dehydrogenase hydrophobic anchor subunit